MDRTRHGRRRRGSSGGAQQLEDADAANGGGHVHRPRDAANSDSDATSSSPRAPPPVARRALLAATYACVIVAGSVPQALYPSLIAAGELTAAEASRALGLQTMGMVVGKAFSGIVVDAAGGRTTLLMALSSLSVLAVALAAAPDSRVLIAAAFLMELVNTPCYPAHGLFVRGWWPSDLISDGFWVLSMSSRVGSMGAGLLYGVLLRTLPWRSVASVAACIAAVGALTSTMHRDTPARKSVTQPVSVRAAVRNYGIVLSDGRFWLAAVAMSALTTVKRFGQAIPIFLVSMAPNVLDKSSASAVAVVFPAGLACSVLLGGWAYGRVSRSGKVMLCTFMLLVSVLSSLRLAAHASELAETPTAVAFKAALVFAVAFGVGTPFYISSGVTAVRVGGAQRTGTVSSLVAVFGYGSGGVFLLAMQPVIEAAEQAGLTRFGHGWSAVWLCLAAIGSAATVLTAVWVYRLHARDGAAAGAIAGTMTVPRRYSGVEEDVALALAGAASTPAREPREHSRVSLV